MALWDVLVELITGLGVPPKGMDRLLVVEPALKNRWDLYENQERTSMADCYFIFTPKPDSMAPRGKSTPGWEFCSRNLVNTIYATRTRIYTHARACEQK